MNGNPKPDNLELHFIEKERSAFRRGKIVRAIFAVLLCVAAASLIAKTLDDNVFGVICLLDALMCTFSGFSMVSRGALFTERRKTMISVTTMTVILASCLYCVFVGHWVRLFFPIVIYVAFTGIGSLVFKSLHK